MAIVYKHQVDPDTEFALWRIEEPADELYRHLQLNEYEKAFIEQLNGKRNLQWLSTRVLLRTLLNTDDYIDCRIDAHGKPYLMNQPYHISLSHSFDYAAVMISRTKPVGIDIEQVNQKVERIAHKFMTPREMAFIEQPVKIPQLYVCWCAKEAIYKCYGQKEVSFAGHIQLEPFRLEDQGSLHARLIKNDIDLPFKVGYLQFNDYMVGYVKGEHQ